jgi:hypothetical protein
MNFGTFGCRFSLQYGISMATATIRLRLVVNSQPTTRLPFLTRSKSVLLFEDPSAGIQGRPREQRRASGPGLLSPGSSIAIQPLPGSTNGETWQPYFSST